MMKALLLVIVSTAILAQNPPVFPGAIATDSDLLVSGNRYRAVLTANITASTLTVPVNSLVNLKVPGTVDIGNETIKVCGSGTLTLTVCDGGRGFDGTSAASHARGSAATGSPGDWKHNQLAAEVKALELVVAANQSGSTIFQMYDFTPQNPSGVLTAGIGKTATLSPVPLGVNATDTWHWLYLSTCSGGAHSVLITGGTAVSGASSGTITFTPTNSCTAGWTIKSGSGGVQEALVACVAPCNVVVPAGDYTLHSPITTPPITTTTAHGYILSGQGRYNTRFTLSSDFPLAASYVFGGGSDGVHLLNGPTLEDLGFILPQTWSNALSTYTHWPTLFKSVLNGNTARRLYVAGAWDGVDFRNTGQHVIDDVQMSAYHQGVTLIDNQDISRIDKLHFWPFTDKYNASYADQDAFYDPAVVGLYASGNAGITVSNSFFISGVCMDLVGGNSLVQISDTACDAAGVIKMSHAGGNHINMSNVTLYQAAKPNGSSGYSCSQAALQFGLSGTLFNATNLKIFRSCATYPAVTVLAPTGFSSQFGSISFSNSAFLEVSDVATTKSIFVIDGTAGTPTNVSVLNSQIGYETQHTYTDPMLALIGTNINLTFYGNTNTGYGDGTWLSIAADAKHVIGPSMQSGPSGTWTDTFPSSKLIGRYSDQSFDYGGYHPIYAAATTGPVTMTGAFGYYPCDATAGALQLNLPFVGAAVGAELSVKKTDSTANTCVVAAGAGDNIDGAATYTLKAQNEVVTFKASVGAALTWFASTNLNWFRTGEPRLTPSTFANLGAPGTNDVLAICSDCNVTSGADNTCTSGGTGAFAVRLNGVWRCFAAQN